MRVPMNETYENSRHWKRVHKDGPIPILAPHLDQCWIWTGYRRPTGYGLLCANGTTRSAHRHILSLFLKEKFNPSLVVLHLCENPSCVRPSHLQQGSQEENVKDMLTKRGHYQSKKTHCKNGHPFAGENLYIYVNPKTGLAYRVCRKCGANKTKEREKRLSLPILSRTV